MSDPRNEPPGSAGEGRLLRLYCPFCRAEYPLWFRPDAEETMSPTEWERWLDSVCRECGKTPREHVRPGA